MVLFSIIVAKDSWIAKMWEQVWERASGVPPFISMIRNWKEWEPILGDCN